jgi:alpha-tubulin suppressor-like RCC1 family protein
MGYKNILIMITSLILSGIILNQAYPSITEIINVKKVENNILKKEEFIYDSICKYTIEEKIFPTSMNDLINKGFFLASYNDNGYGEPFTFLVDKNKGIISISTKIIDSKISALLINTNKSTFKAVQEANNIVALSFVIPSDLLSDNSLETKLIPIQSTSPDATLNKYWYDTSSGKSVLKISNGSSWKVLASNKSTIIEGEVLPPEEIPLEEPELDIALNTSMESMVTNAENGDIKYLYNSDTGNVEKYVYKDGRFYTNKAPETKLYYEYPDYYQTISKVKSFSLSLSGNFTCAIVDKYKNEVLIEDKVGYCWGLNTTNRLGDGTTTQRLTPTNISNPLSGTRIKFKEIYTGANYGCGIEDITNLGYCWGTNTNGKLGDNTAVNKTIPTLIVGTNMTAGIQNQWKKLILDGTNFTCGIGMDDKGYCWGLNTTNRLGDGTVTQRNLPVVIGGGAGKFFKEIYTGVDYGCGIEVGTNLGYCWGTNTNGKLGDNTVVTKTIPTLIIATNMTAGIQNQWKKLILGGTNFTCGIGMDDKGYCWGLNTNGNLGDNSVTSKSIPVQISTLLVDGSVNQWKDIQVGDTYVCGIHLSNNLGYCWGINTNPSRLGINIAGTVKYDDPNPIVGTNIPTIGNKWNSFQTGPLAANFSCGISYGTNDGYCWGLGTSGQLGDNTSLSKNLPIAISKNYASNGFLEIKTSNSYACGIEKDTYDLFCWGVNTNGRAGSSSGSSYNTPMKVIFP